MARIKRNSPEARLYKYHPIRFHLLRDDPIWIQAIKRHDEWIKKDRKYSLIGVAEAIAMDHEEGPSLLHPVEQIIFSNERVQAALIDDSQEASFEESIFIDWNNNGEQIFDLSLIAALFVDNDASNVPLANIKLPFEAFYLYWGKHLQIDSAVPQQYIDGCYVSRDNLGSDSVVNFLFTSTINTNYRWDEHSLLANLVIDAEGLLGCIDTFSENKTFKEVSESFYIDNIYPESTTLKWNKYLPSALSMAANCLCYLGWENAETKVTYSAEAPAKLVAQSESQKLTESRRAKSKLSSLGFKQIHICGQNLAEKVGLTEGSAQVPPHWRRGHWRHQRHGSARAKIKVIWINGMVVNADKGAPDQGHIYIP